MHGIVLFKNITIRPKLARAKVLETPLEHPQEKDEFFVLEKGFFTLHCNRGMDEAKEKLHKAKMRGALAPWVLAFEAFSTTECEPDILRWTLLSNSKNRICKCLLDNN